jgi:N-acetylglucosamine-6-sulfatase
MRARVLHIRGRHLVTRRLVAFALLAMMLLPALLIADERRDPRPSAKAGATGGARTERPNVLVIFTDDQDAASLRVMSSVRRRLVAKGTRFTDAVVSLPQCCPSRATLLSGQYAHNHGVRDNSPPRGGYTAFDGANSLPVWLQRAGYRTGWIGKYLNGYGNPAQGTDAHEVPPGWSDWTAPVNHTEYEMFGYTLNHNGVLRDYGAGPRDYQTDVYARAARRFIRTSAEEPSPFFLTVAPLAPHQEGGRLDDHIHAPRNPRPAPRDLGRFQTRPLPHPPSFNERHDGDKTAVVTSKPHLDRAAMAQLTKIYRSRLESLLAVDDMVGSLIGTLRETGQLRDTLVIFTSDQGYLLGEHHLIGKNRLYDEALRVPLVIRGPGVAAGRVRRDLVSNVDLAPTIVAATGARPGLLMDGRSLLTPPAARGRPGGARELLLELFHGGRFAGLRTSRYAYLDFGNRGIELYDLRADPYELRNLAGDRKSRSVEARLRADLQRLRTCSGAGCR